MLSPSLSVPPGRASKPLGLAGFGPTITLFGPCVYLPPRMKAAVPSIASYLFPTELE